MAVWNRFSNIIIDAVWRIFALRQINNFRYTYTACSLISGPTDDIPVKVTGNVKAGFTAEFVPMEVGIQMVRTQVHSSPPDIQCLV